LGAPKNQFRENGFPVTQQPVSGSWFSSNPKTVFGLPKLIFNYTKLLKIQGYSKLIFDTPKPVLSTPKPVLRNPGKKMTWIPLQDSNFDY
jgi:hypothetical protein